MAELSAFERVLLSHNPFRDAVVRHGFDAPEDVEEIHGEARARLRELIEECRRDGRPRLQVVAGEPGDGKTHLLACLRAEADRSWRGPRPLSLAPIDPIRQLEMPFVHLLRGWASAALRPLGSGAREPDEPAAPLELLLWRILWRAAASLVDHPEPEVAEAAAAIAAIDPGKWPTLVAVDLRAQWPLLERPLREDAPARFAAGARVDLDVWRALCRFPEPEQAPRLCRWLSGRSLPEEELRALGVDGALDDEDGAFRALSTLANLSDVPLVLGLDQLEGVRRLGEDAVPALFQAITSLYSAGGRLVILFFCQAAIWSELFGALPQHVRDRLEPRELALGNVSPAQGERLIERRLQPLWRAAGAAPPHPTAPFPDGWVRAEIARRHLLQPRRILGHFASIGLTDRPPGDAPPAPAVPPRELVRRAFARVREELSAQGRGAEDRAELAQAGLAGVLERAAGKALGETTVVAARKRRVTPRAAPGVEARLQRGGQEVRVYAEAHNGQNGVSAAAAVRRCKKALEQSAGRALLLRDEDLPLPKGAAAQLEELGPRGGVVRLPLAELLDLGALERLLDAASAGELDGVSEALALQEIDGSLAAGLGAVARFFDAAFAPAQPNPATRATAASAPARAAVERALERPPHVASAAAIAEASGLGLEEVLAGAESLEKAGLVQVVVDKDGARGMVRRPR